MLSAPDHSPPPLRPRSAGPLGDRKEKAPWFRSPRVRLPQRRARARLARRRPCSARNGVMIQRTLGRRGGAPRISASAAIASLASAGLSAKSTSCAIECHADPELGRIRIAPPRQATAGLLPAHRHLWPPAPRERAHRRRDRASVTRHCPRQRQGFVECADAGEDADLPVKRGRASTEALHIKIDRLADEADLTPDRRSSRKAAAIGQPSAPAGQRARASGRRSRTGLAAERRAGTERQA